ncbi:MAG: hypothetical protein HKN92_07010 [Chitinophagales bacterium]|nr:hypothetical protein [Chitinophagales bacterium]
MELGRFNIIYVLVILSGVSIWLLSNQYNKNVELFYGFAETKETEINMDHPVMVDSIFVTAGEFVNKGQPILNVSYADLEAKIGGNNFRIKELQAKESVWQIRLQSEIDNIYLEKIEATNKLNEEIAKLETQIEYRKKINSEIQSDQISLPVEKLESAKKTLEEEKAAMLKALEKRVSALQSERVNNPYRSERERIESSILFDTERTLSKLAIKAPSDGLIGNVHCLEGEHIRSYQTLITFYQPNPTIVKGFVHEDLIVKVRLNDVFKVSSTKNQDLQYNGVVTGLGSRIVEIPTRLRKFEDLKTYGREVLIKIPADNEFLQKEKVVVNFVKSKNQN